MTTSISLTPETVQSTVQQYFAASRSDAKVEAMVACFAPDCVNFDPAEGSALQGHAAMRQYLTTLATLFAQIGLQEDFISINGNQAAVKWTGHGITHTGTEVTFEGIDLFELNAEGQIQCLRGYWNPAALMAHL